LAALELLEPLLCDFTDYWVIQTAVVAYNEAVEHHVGLG
jgi:hypothetical protein